VESVSRLCEHLYTAAVRGHSTAAGDLLGLSRYTRVRMSCLHGKRFDGFRGASRSHVLLTPRRTVFVRNIICCCIQTNRRAVYIHECVYTASVCRPVPSITGYLCNSRGCRLIQKVQSDPLMPVDNDTVASCVGIGHGFGVRRVRSDVGK